MGRRMKVLVMVLGLAAVMFAAGGVALAHTGSVNLGVIHACVNNGGQLTIVGPNDTCPGNQTPLDWNAEGQQGPQGNPGLVGPEGPVGPAGAGGLSNVTFVFTDSVIADQQLAGGTSYAAVCPVGTLATGGGWAMQGTIGVGSNLDSFLVIANSPYGSMQGWQVMIRRSGPAGIGREWGVRIFAICATVAP